MDYTIIVVCTFIIMVGAIIMYGAWSLIDHYLESKRDMRRMEFIEYMIPVVRNEVEEMSIETITRINDRIYNQFLNEEKES